MDYKDMDELSAEDFKKVCEAFKKNLDKLWTNYCDSLFPSEQLPTVSGFVKFLTPPDLSKGR